MPRILKYSSSLALAAVVLASTSCGSAVRDGRSPMLLEVDSLKASRGAATPGPLSGFLTSDVLTNVTTPAPCSPSTPCPTVFDDSAEVELRAILKDIGTPTSPTVPTTNNDITITRYHVEYTRSDGRNTQGVDVPYSIDGGATGTLAGGGTLTLGFELVRHVAKQETPLVQLTNNRTIISTTANVTFYGHDAAGNEINATGSISVNFGNFGDQ